MKLSSLIKGIGQVVFWACMFWIMACMAPEPLESYWYPIIGAILWVALYFVRKYRFLHYPVFPHMMILAAFTGAQILWQFMTAPMLVLTGWMLLLSFLAETFYGRYMDEPKPFGVVVFTLVLLIAYVGDFGNVTLLFVAYAVHLYCFFYGNVQEDYEKEIGRLKNSSHLDEKQMLAQSTLPALLGCLLVGALSFAVSLVGNLPVFVGILKAFKKAMLSAYYYIRDGITSRFPGETETEPDYGTDSSPQTEQSISEDVYDVAAIFFGVAFIVSIVGLLIYSFIRKTKDKKVMIEDVEEEHESNKKTEEKTAKKRKARRPDAGIRRNMRRMYSKQVRKGRGRRNDDLTSRTPEEHRKMKQNEGMEMSREFVDFYEKARYGNEDMTKEDLRNMAAEVRRKENS